MKSLFQEMTSMSGTQWNASLEKGTGWIIFKFKIYIYIIYDTWDILVKTRRERNVFSGFARPAKMASCSSVQMLLLLLLQMSVSKYLIDF